MGEIVDSVKRVTDIMAEMPKWGSPCDFTVLMSAFRVGRVTLR
jgi:hypothetical protein